MSNKNNINDFLNTTSTEFKHSISNIKIFDKNNIQKGGNYSPTSSFNQLGGNINNDVNNLVSMLTSDSHMSTILNSNTSTPELENKLRKLLNQEGGHKNNNINTNDNINNYFIKEDASQNGGSASTLLAGAAVATLLYSLTSNETSITKMVSNLIGSKNEPEMTTTDMNNIDSATSSVLPSQRNNMFSDTSKSQRGGSITSSVMPDLQYNNSITSEMHMEQEGGNNPALVAFREIVKMLVKELNIKYPQGFKIASQLQKDVKEKNANVTHDNLAKLAAEEFKSNKSKYQKMV